ncbi:hypothetical protein [Labrys monachus]|uniref:DUF2946 domain-containing protein n=1 Tax=Labrys monachus TaxID=217067 RepID=A0ABU0FJS8_9HYPH|nr:hypothetical protein [Labrys monachus]MDQ0394869.1 hypothetical protein [Labrys monachus]
MLAFVVAIALLLAPLGVAGAAPCPPRAGPCAVLSEHPAGAAAHHHDGSRDSGGMADHKACCGSACGLCCAAIAAESAVPARLATGSRRLVWHHRIVEGVAFPPALDPPRPMV